MRERGFIAFVSIVLSLICLYYLSFTYYASKIEKQASAYTKGNSEKEQYLDSISKDTTNFLFLEYNYADAKNRSLNLGLDLKGGINVILQISERDLLLKISENSKNPIFISALNQADNKQKASGASDYLELFFLAFQEQKKIQKSNINLSSSEIFGKKSLVDQVDYSSPDEMVEKVIRQKVETSIATAYDVIRSRIDRFGVTQPNIQCVKRSGRILVELPGVKDIDRVKKLLQSTAQLHFYEVYQPQEVYAYLELLNKRFLHRVKSTSFYSSPELSKNRVEAIIEKKNFAKEKEAVDKVKKGSFFELLNIQKALRLGNIGLVDAENIDLVNKILSDPQATELRPAYLRSAKFLWSAKPEYTTGKKKFTLFAIRSGVDGAPAINGDVVVDSEKSFDQFNKVIVNMRMNSEGSREWRRITEKNVNKRIAVVLDDLVYTAPVVNTMIPDGRSQISGNFSIQEADDLINVLSAGKLPTPAKIIQAEIVGPSLGKEAIQSGLNSSFIALGSVFLWMLIYYTTAGLYANLALVFNLLFLFGILISLGAVVTLPGIAGIVLTLAMAVDANILLYERVKEELHKGKSLRKAIDESYSFKGALSSIIDGQLTTLLTGIILFIFGKGPIQGFATTLIIGIFTSLFSAIWLTRWFIECHFSKKKHLSFFSKLTEYFLKNIHWDFLSKRRYAYIFSSILMVIGLISLASRGLNLGVDFVGGRTYVIRLDRVLTPEKAADQIGRVLIENGRHSSPEVKVFGKSNQLKITTKYKATEDNPEVDDELVEKLYTALKSYLPAYLSMEDFKNVNEGQSLGILSSVRVGPTVAKDITNGAFLAVFFSLLVVFIYILIRFRKWQFSLGAVISLLHDALVVLGVFSIFYGFFPFSLEIDQAFIAAILTVIGYSINDTVIVYDRIREYISENPRRPFRKMTNEAINSTLSRTINTSLITLFVLFVIFVFGGETIRGFTFALLVGIGFGTYSSVFVSTSLMYDFIKRELKKSDKPYLEKY